MKLADVKALRRHYEEQAEELRWKVRDSADREMRERYLLLRDVARSLDVVLEDAENGRIPAVEK